MESYGFGLAEAHGDHGGGTLTSELRAPKPTGEIGECGTCRGDGEPQEDSQEWLCHRNWKGVPEWEFSTGH
jgi:hypothetical protein